MTEALDKYICDHSDPEPELLHRIERESNLHLLNGRMCSGHLQGRLLKMFVAMIHPRRVLELGTFSGYSALCMAEALDDDARIVTLEIDDELEDTIRHNFSRSPHGHKIEPLFGDALDIMSRFEDEAFDLIFIDADKRRYTDYYKEALRLLCPGGFIIADNTLWYGHVIEEEKQRDPQTAGIVRFNDFVAADPRVERVILPLRDGLTLIRKL